MWRVRHGTTVVCFIIPYKVREVFFPFPEWQFQSPPELHRRKLEWREVDCRLKLIRVKQAGRHDVYTIMATLRN